MLGTVHVTGDRAAAVRECSGRCVWRTTDPSRRGGCSDGACEQIWYCESHHESRLAGPRGAVKFRTDDTQSVGTRLRCWCDMHIGNGLAPRSKARRRSQAGCKPNNLGTRLTSTVTQASNADCYAGTARCQLGWCAL